MSASALMFVNCCQCACETCTSKATHILIRWKHWYFHQIIGVPVMRRNRPDKPQRHPKEFQGVLQEDDRVASMASMAT